MSIDKNTRERGSALHKALAILEAIADQPQPVGLPDLTARVNLPRQTVHRVLQQLEKSALIVRDPTRARFSIGPRFSRLSLAALSSANSSAPARIILQALVDDIQETCNIGVLDGLEYVYLERIECHWPLRVHLQAGSRVPSYCVSGGKMMLAFQPKPIRERLLKAKPLKSYTDFTKTSFSDLENSFSEIRDQGYAINNQEYSHGILGIAVPIRDNTGRPRAALALQAPLARLSVEKGMRHIPKLKAAAERLTDAWGLDAPANIAAE